MKKIFLLTFVIFFATSFSTVFAGGPIIVKNGMTITYGTRPLLYRYDQGPLGKFNNADAIKLFEDRFHDWQSIITSRNKFKRDNPGSLEFDVTADNFDPILNSKDLLGYTPIIFDADGKILDAFLGKGAGNSVLGLSGPITEDSGPLADQIAESQAVFNGRFIDGIKTPLNPESSLDSFKGTIIHEFGHGQGLDHSQINIEAIKPGASQDIKDAVPLMFPIAVNELFLVRRDDASAISLLYPEDTELSNFGKIEGKILRQDTITPVLGANVIARNINNPILEAISCVSDYLTDSTGSFTLFAVPPGDYRIEIEPIDLSFTDASGVGPYTKDKTDKSFQNPVPNGFYTGSNKPITTDKDQALIVMVIANKTISNVNIIAGTSIVPNSSGSNSIPTINETEPNDTPETAQLITLPVTIKGNASLGDNGVLNLSSDTGAMLLITDLFKFTLTQGASINALLKIDNEDSSSKNDLDLLLFNSSGTQILDSSSLTRSPNELISKSLKPGTYLLGIGAVIGSSPYTLEITLFKNEKPPSLVLSGKNTLVLKPTRNNTIKLAAKASNFSKATTCKVLSSDDSSLKIKPKKFPLSAKNNKQTIRVTIPKTQALDLITNKSTKNVTVSVICNNGTSDEKDILLTPFSIGIKAQDLQSPVK